LHDQATLPTASSPTSGNEERQKAQPAACHCQRSRTTTPPPSGKHKANTAADQQEVIEVFDKYLKPQFQSVGLRPANGGVRISDELVLSLAIVPGIFLR